MRLSRAIGGYLADTALTKAKATVRAYSASLERMRRYASKDSVAAFDEALVRKVLAESASAGMSANTRAGYVVAMRNFGAWCVRNELLARNPALDPRFNVKPQQSLPKPFEADEAERLMNLELPLLQSAVRATLYYTGLRVTPIVDLLISGVSFNPPGVRSIGKGSKQHWVPMAPSLAEVLKRYLNENPGQSYDRLFRDGGKPLNRRRIERWCNEWGARAEVKNVHPHRFRHTFATDILEKSKRLEVVQKLLGHASIQTTQVYARVKDSALTDAINMRQEYATGLLGTVPQMEVGEIRLDESDT